MWGEDSRDGSFIQSLRGALAGPEGEEGTSRGQYGTQNDWRLSTRFDCVKVGSRSGDRSDETLGRHGV